MDSIRSYGISAALKTSGMEKAQEVSSLPTEDTPKLIDYLNKEITEIRRTMDLIQKDGSMGSVSEYCRGCVHTLEHVLSWVVRNNMDKPIEVGKEREARLITSAYTIGVQHGGVLDDHFTNWGYTVENIYEAADLKEPK